MPLARYADALSDQSLAPEWPMNRQRPRRSLVAHVRERRSAAATPQATLLTASPGPSLPCNTLEARAVPLFVSQSPSFTPGPWCTTHRLRCASGRLLANTKRALD